jgi:hypothetical protein
MNPYQKYGTALGAVFGLLTVRGLLPPERRDAATYALGGVGGAGVGYLGGSVAHDNKGAIKGAFEDLTNPPSKAREVTQEARTLGSTLRKDPRGSAEDFAMSASRMMEQPGYDAGTGDEPVTIGPLQRPGQGGSTAHLQRLFRQRAEKMRASMAGQQARMEGDTDRAEKADIAHGLQQQKLTNLSGQTDEKTTYGIDHVRNTLSKLTGFLAGPE